MMYVVVDLEATKKNWRSKQSSIVEIGAVKLDHKMEIMDTFYRFVKPKFKRLISNDFLMNQNRSDIANADDIHTVNNEFVEWIGNDEYVLVFWSKSDLNILFDHYEIERFDFNKWLKNYCDLQENFKNYFDLDSHPSITTAMNSFNRLYEGVNHCAIDDAWNTAMILQEVSKLKEITYYNNPYEFKACKLYKKCKICNEIKLINLMRKNNPWKNKRKKGGYTRIPSNICLACHYKIREEKVNLDLAAGQKKGD